MCRPSATVNGRSMWARLVAEDWVEQRERSREGLIKAVSADRDTLPTGRADLWTRFTKVFFSGLWEQPNWRERWALRWRNEAAVREVAEDLSWDVVANERQIIPVYDLATTVRKALLHDFAHGKDLHDGLHRCRARRPGVDSITENGPDPEFERR